MHIFHKKDAFDIKIFIFQIISIIAIIICLIKIITWYNENNSNNNLKKELIESTFTNIDNSNIDFSHLFNINPKTVGWLVVNNTSINYSVVKGEDNSFYLTHSFDNSYNSAGWIFADYQNKFDGTDKNIIIYGHNRRDGSMFSTLKNVLEEDWYLNADNHIITLFTPNSVLKYQVFSVYSIPVTEANNQTTFSSDSEYFSFLDKLKNKSIYDFNVNLSTKDSILTLSTCANNNSYRVVLNAKLLN